METQTALANALKLDLPRCVDQISSALRRQVLTELKRKGGVVGLSGGIDSSVVAALSVRALGKERVLGLLMPERESSEDSLALGRLVADHLGIPALVEDITPALEAVGCYRKRDEMIQSVVPNYESGCKCKIVLPDLSGSAYRIFSVVVEFPDGTQVRARLTP